MKKIIPKHDAFLGSYLETALWSSTDNRRGKKDAPLDRSFSIRDFSCKAIEAARKDCEDFQAAQRELLDASGLSEAKQGHNFWLSRNGHGAGFFDCGCEGADELQKAARVYGSVDLYVWRGLVRGE